MNFPTTTQQHTNWCMIATAWMITKYHHYYTQRTQQNIADYMGVDINSGASASEEIYYYTHDYLGDNVALGGAGMPTSVSSYTTSGAPAISYNLIKGEVDSNRPMKISVWTNGGTQHAKALIGYWLYTDGRVLYKYSDPADGISRWVYQWGTPGSTDLSYVSYVMVRP